jgi:hypothetical protein
MARRLLIAVAVPYAFVVIQTPAFGQAQNDPNTGFEK